MMKVGEKLEVFYYLIDLHYSQTFWFVIAVRSSFYYLIDLHYSQTTLRQQDRADSFTTL